MGFDCSKEVFIKGENSVAIIFDVTPEHSLVVFFEMNPLKVEFFDCETFITTIDDLMVNLIEALSYDNAIESNEGDGNPKK